MSSFWIAILSLANVPDKKVLAMGSALAENKAKLLLFCCFGFIYPKCPVLLSTSCFWCGPVTYAIEQHQDSFHLNRDLDFRTDQSSLFWSASKFVCSFTPSPNKRDFLVEKIK